MVLLVSVALLVREARNGADEPSASLATDRESV